jgi:putative oxidoreductase
MTTRPQLRALVPFAPLALRLAWGMIFIAHGAQKFMGLDHTTQFFTGLGILLPGIAAPLIALLEVVGGIALLLGLGTRIFALLLAVNMLVAILTAKLTLGLVGGFEFELALLAGCITLALSGPGIPAIMRDRQSSVDI